MKHFSLILSLLTSLPHLSLTNSLSAVTNPHDLQYITNLVYWSYKRSQANYNAQKAAFEQLQESWRLWHCTTKIRLNPAQYPLLTHCVTKPAPLSASLEQLRRASAAYTHALTYINSTRSAHARDYITRMRSQARYQSARIILAYILTHAGKILQKTKIPARTTHTLHESLNNLSSFGAALFGKTDIHYTKASDTVWQKFLVTQKLHHNLWLAIEQTRTEFYLKHYIQCYKALHALTQERDYHTLIIDEHGVSMGSRATAPLLPSPEQLPKL